MNADRLEHLKHLIRALSGHFGSSTELVIHDLETPDPRHTVLAIENGHVTGRKVGDGPSHIVQEAMEADPEALKDRLAYLTKTDDGKLLKSSTIYLRDADGKPYGILAINSDITLSVALEMALRDFHTPDVPDEEPEPITTNVADMLDSLIWQSIERIGKPAALMTKDEKVQAIRFLNDSGAFLITRSGPKVCEAFHISKFTLYSYLDEAKQI